MSQGPFSEQLLVLQQQRGAAGVPITCQFYAHTGHSSSTAFSPVSPASGDGGDLGYYRAEVVTLKFHMLNLRGRLFSRFPFVRGWEFLCRRFEGNQLPHYHRMGVAVTFWGPTVHLSVKRLSYNFRYERTSNLCAVLF